MFIHLRSSAQTSAEIKQAKRLYSGSWVNKKAKRHLMIFIEPDGYVTINDWTSPQERGSGDAYKAYIKNGKLIMPALPEHHGPYCEMRIKGKNLLYLCASINPTQRGLTDQEVYVREP